MIKSMTGFGRGSAESEGVKVTAEIRTVNNRHLDVHVRLSQEFADLELAVKKQIQAALKRGRADVTITVERGGSVAYDINREAVRAYLDAVGVLKEEFGLGGDIAIDSIVRLPGVLQASSTADAAETVVAETVVGAVTAAVSDLVAMRAVEGSELAAEMNGRLDKIESLVPLIEGRADALPS